MGQPALPRIEVDGNRPRGRYDGAWQLADAAKVPMPANGANAHPTSTSSLRKQSTRYNGRRATRKRYIRLQFAVCHMSFL
jgi:hypothetical protein